MSQMRQDREATTQEALESLSTGRLTSIRRAAALYGIPNSTFEGHQEQRLLTQTQEEELVQWIRKLDNNGFAPAACQVKEMVTNIMRYSDRSAVPTIRLHWLSRFKVRNPAVSPLINERVNASRVNGTSYEALSNWFNLLSTCLARKGVKPENIYNMAETGIALGVCGNQTVLGASGKKKIKTPNGREWVSVVETVGATGCVLTSAIIFKEVGMQSSWFSPGDIPNWQYTTSPNGWTSNEIALHWLRTIFLPETSPNTPGEPRLLIMDGHKTHCTVEFMYNCRLHNVELLFLPPHSSQVTQPLDLTCFSPVEGRYRAQISMLAQYDDAAPVKKINFVRFYNLAREESLTARTITNSFKAAGIHPFNPHQVYSSPAQAGSTNSSIPARQTRKPTTKRPHDQLDICSTPKPSKRAKQSLQQLNIIFKSHRTVRTRRHHQ